MDNLFHNHMGGDYLGIKRNQYELLPLNAVTGFRGISRKAAYVISQELNILLSQPNKMQYLRLNSYMNISNSMDTYPIDKYKNSCVLNSKSFKIFIVSTTSVVLGILNAEKSL